MQKLSVAFIYEAIVVKPRCRKPSLVTIKDKVDIQIKTTTQNELPVAFKVGKDLLRWDGKQLWDFYLDQNPEGELRKVDIAEVIKNTHNNGATYKYSCAGAPAPFKNFWSTFRWGGFKLGKKYGTNECGFDKHLDDDDVFEKSQVKYREWVEDNREQVLSKLNNIVDNLLVVDGIMHQKVGEPRYEVMSFGAGHNYSVGMFISYTYNPNLSNKCYFNALDYDKAQATFIKKNPNKEKVAKPNCGSTIEVLIESAVKCKPKEDHVD